RAPRRVPVKESKIQPLAYDLRPEFLSDLPIEILSGLTVDETMYRADVAPIERGEVQEICIRKNRGQDPCAWNGHLDLPLYQCLDNICIGEQLATVKYLAFNPPF